MNAFGEPASWINKDNAFGDKPDPWEKLLPESDCSKEKIKISILEDEITRLNDALKEKNEITRLNDALKEQNATSRLEHEITALNELNDALKEQNATLRTSMFSHRNLPTLANVTKSSWLKPDYDIVSTMLKKQNQDLVNENEKLIKLLRNSSNKGEGGSRRFRKHKRSAARRRSTASRRRYKNRK
jgi:hypothetical protein